MKRQSAYFVGIILTVFDILFLAYITFYHVSGSVRNMVIAFDLLLCALFWVEFLYNLKRSDDRRTYLKNNSLGILGMLPVNFIFFRALRFVKLAQLIKIFILIRDDEKVVSDFLHKTYLDKIIAVSIIFVVLITILIWAVDSNIVDFRTAIWYIFVSMTSTGYGDVVPASTSGRIIGIVAMVGGIIIFSLITAIISSAYISKLNRQNRKDMESKIDNLTAKVEMLSEKIDELSKK